MKTIKRWWNYDSSWTTPQEQIILRCDESSSYINPEINPPIIQATAQSGRIADAKRASVCHVKQFRLDYPSFFRPREESDRKSDSLEAATLHGGAPNAN